METVSLPFVDKINAFLGLVVAFLSYFLGKEWFLFVGFFALNVIDYITGVIKARKNHVENSTKGVNGVLKKLSYWLMILTGFIVSMIFRQLGDVIGINLDFSVVIGWFVMASLFINEIRSIIENFVEAGFNVPKVLSKGLEVADKLIDEKTDGLFKDDKKDSK